MANQGEGIRVWEVAVAFLCPKKDQGQLSTDCATDLPEVQIPGFDIGAHQILPVHDALLLRFSGKAVAKPDSAVAVVQGELAPFKGRTILGVTLFCRTAPQFDDGFSTDPVVVTLLHAKTAWCAEQEVRFRVLEVSAHAGKDYLPPMDSLERIGLPRTELYLHKTLWYANDISQRQQKLVEAVRGAGQKFSEEKAEAANAQTDGQFHQEFSVAIQTLLHDMAELETSLHAYEANKNNIAVNLHRLGRGIADYPVDLVPAQSEVESAREAHRYARTRVDTLLQSLTLSREVALDTVARGSLRIAVAAFWLGGINLLSLFLGIWVQSVQDSAYSLPPPAFRAVCTATVAALVTLAGYRRFTRGARENLTALGMLLVALLVIVGVVWWTLDHHKPATPSPTPQRSPR